LDECQNLSAAQLKTIITRCGEGTKLICSGNLSQIDSNYLTAYPILNLISKLLPIWFCWPQTGVTKKLSKVRKSDSEIGNTSKRLLPVHANRLPNYMKLDEVA